MIVFLILSFSQRIVCDKCVPSVRARVVELQVGISLSLFPLKVGSSLCCICRRVLTITLPPLPISRFRFSENRNLFSVNFFFQILDVRLAATTAPVSKNKLADELSSASAKGFVSLSFYFLSQHYSKDLNGGNNNNNSSGAVAAAPVSEHNDNSKKPEVVSPANVVASPRPEDAIPDLENTPVWNGQSFKWSDVGLPPSKQDFGLLLFVCCSSSSFL